MNERAQRFHKMIGQVREENPGCAIDMDMDGFPVATYSRPSEPLDDLRNIATELAKRWEERHNRSLGGAALVDQVEV